MARPMIDLMQIKLDSLLQLDFTPFHTMALKMLDAPCPNIDQLTKILSLDKPLVQQIVLTTEKQGNRKVESLPQAIRLLGHFSVKAIILEILAAREQSHRLNPAIAELMQGRLWRHSQLVAICSQLLAQSTGYFNPSHAYTAGLFHDLGAILLHAGIAEDTLQMLDLSNDMPLETNLDRSFGLNHALLGATMLECWGVSPAVTDPVLVHHKPRKAKLNKRLATIIHLADVAVDCQQCNLPIGIRLFPVDKVALTMFPLGKEDIQKMAQQAAVLLDNRTAIERTLESGIRSDTLQQVVLAGLSA